MDELFSSNDNPQRRRRPPYPVAGALSPPAPVAGKQQALDRTCGLLYPSNKGPMPHG